MPSDDSEQRHRRQMQRKKATIDAAIAAADDERGLLLISPDALVAIADTVTEMILKKHAFQAGVKAMRGIEW
jgi:ATP:corrinoid adenosyltransferase